MARSKRTEAGRQGRGPGEAGRARPRRPGETGDPPGVEARRNADMMRQAECAAMLLAVTRMLLNLRGRDFATWLRSIADDFEATDPDTEQPEDLAQELVRMASGEQGKLPEDEHQDGGEPPSSHPPSRRHH